MEKLLKRLSTILVMASFFVPMVVMGQQFIFPFIVPKIVIFRSITLLLLGAFLLLLLIDKKRYAPKMHILHISVFGYLLSLIVSTFVGVDWYRSFWDNHERMLGTFTIIHYVLYYLILSTVIVKEQLWKKLFGVFLGTGTFVMLFGFVQRFISPDLLLNNGALRVSATLGNPIYYSGFGLFLFLSGAYMAIKERQDVFWRWYGALTSLCGLIGVFLGGTRGAILGLVAACGTGVVMYGFLFKDHKRVRQIVLAIMAAGLILMGTLFVFRSSDFVGNIPGVGRLLQIKISANNTRIMAWGVAVDAWQEKPVFGWGPNNYYYAFNKYYRPAFLEHGYGETWFDNAHNIVMNTLATQGAIGLLLYLSIFVAAITYMARAYRSGGLDIHTFVYGTVFLVGHFVSIVFVFENPTSWLYFFFVLAYIAVKSTPQQVRMAESVKKAHLSPIGLTVISGVILLFIFATNINPARANMQTLQTIRVTNGALPSSQLVTEYESLFTQSTPHIDDIRNDMARTLGTVLDAYIQKGDVDGAMALLDVIGDELQKNIKLHPADIRIYITYAQLLMIQSNIRQDLTYTIRAVEILDQALVYSPERQQIKFMLANAYLNIRNFERTEQLLRETIDADPLVPEGWWRLAWIYFQMDKKEEARGLLTDAESRGVRFKGEGLEVYNAVMLSEI